MSHHFERSVAGVSHHLHDVVCRLQKTHMQANQLVDGISELCHAFVACSQAHSCSGHILWSSKTGCRLGVCTTAVAIAVGCSAIAVDTHSRMGVCNTAGAIGCN